MRSLAIAGVANELSPSPICSIEGFVLLTETGLSDLKRFGYCLGFSIVFHRD
jgi:hypothetical protein